MSCFVVELTLKIYVDAVPFAYFPLFCPNHCAAFVPHPTNICEVLEGVMY